MNAPLTDYEATYRRSELAMPLVVGIAIVGGLALTAIVVWIPTDRNFESRVLSAALVFVVALLSVFLVIFRRHRWTLEKDGISIHERPRVPLAGISHRAFVPYRDIIAFRDLESGFDYLIEIVARNGRRYRMAQAMVQEKGKRFMSVDMNARLGDLAASIRDAAARAGAPLPATTQGMSFWNTIPGLAFIGFLLLVSLIICGGVVLALTEGFTTRQPRGGEAMAILLLLPVGAFILLRKMWRRRQTVLASLRQNSPVRRM
jgi:hypothetical protein